MPQEARPADEGGAGARRGRKAPPAAAAADSRRPRGRRLPAGGHQESAPSANGQPLLLVCSACSKPCAPADFTHNQLTKGGSRRCRSCVSLEKLVVAAKGVVEAEDLPAAGGEREAPPAGATLLPCAACGQELPGHEFSQSQLLKNGKRRCKGCVGAVQEEERRLAKEAAAREKVLRREEAKRHKEEAKRHKEEAKSHKEEARELELERQRREKEEAEELGRKAEQEAAERQKRAQELGLVASGPEAPSEDLPCSGCGRSLPRSSFSKGQRGKGSQRRCEGCVAVAQEGRRKAAEEAEREQKRREEEEEEELGRKRVELLRAAELERLEDLSLCSACGQQRPSREFSKAQRGKGAQQRRCDRCVAKGVPAGPRGSQEPQEGETPTPPSGSRPTHRQPGAAEAEQDGLSDLGVNDMLSLLQNKTEEDMRNAAVTGRLECHACGDSLSESAFAYLQWIKVNPCPAPRTRPHPTCPHAASPASLLPPAKRSAVPSIPPCLPAPLPPSLPP